MLVLLSPAKTLDFAPVDLPDVTQPRFPEQTARLAEVLRKHSPRKLSDLMHMSDALGELNAERYGTFDTPASLAAAKPALLAFRGDVYRGLEADDFDGGDLAFAQARVRTLSGLYGVLRPLDLIQPYRLEMGTKLKVGATKDLYGFWGERITALLRDDLAAAGAEFVLDAASKEYMAAVDASALGVPVVAADFRERRGGKLKFITYNAKVARGGAGARGGQGPDHDARRAHRRRGERLRVRGRAERGGGGGVYQGVRLRGARQAKRDDLHAMRRGHLLASALLLLRAVAWSQPSPPVRLGEREMIAAIANLRSEALTATLPGLSARTCGPLVA